MNASQKYIKELIDDDQNSEEDDGSVAFLS